MKISYLLLTSMFIIGNSCHKDGINLSSATTQDSTPTAARIYNPIIGKWELGTFKILCAGAPDTTIYPNERGDFIEFRKNDTAYYTYNTTNATGRSPYKVLDSSRFILGDTMRIISYDGVRLATYCKSSNGASQQWMTCKKAVN